MRLVSYNIHKGIGGQDRRYRLERIVDVLMHLQADFMCLQEVTIDLPRTSTHDQARILAERFKPMNSFFQQNVYWKRGGYGNLILSRWKLREQHRICLRYGQKKPRGAQLVVIDTPDGPLRLVNWHLGLSERERLWQAAKLLHHETWKATMLPNTLITGDFNDWRNTLERSVLSQHQLQHVAHPPSRFRSFPAMLPMMSLDKAFHHPGVVIEHASVCNTQLARQASDHLPLVIDFRLADSQELVQPTSARWDYSRLAGER
jgi:endonuclease/exonuclease/phosphatase family metal-dependent hydrolase